jgi:glycosyltransferase involved in cell wall biosynthesis
MELYLESCLDSLLLQNLDISDYEIIIVNDESEDNTLRIAQEYEKKQDNIIIIDKKNAGVGAARNSGYDIARGRFLYFLDPDDYLAENTLPTLIERMEKNNLDILTFNSKPVVQKRYPISDNPGKPVNTLEVKDGVSYIASRKYRNEIWWYLIDREFMQLTGIRFIEGKWMEDAILTSELFLKARRMAHIDLDVHRYRILPTSAMRNKTPEHYNKVIYDNAHAAYVFDSLIKNIPATHPKAEACIKRLKTRQQSFVFFLMVRLMKSDISVTKIPEMLKGFEQIDAYPLNEFLGEDYQGLGYSFLVLIFNRKPLIDPFIKIFRTFHTLAR